MESVITVAGAHEGGHGIGNWDRPEWRVLSGREGALRPLGSNDSMSSGFMFKSSSFNFPESYEIVEGSLKSFRPVRLELVSGSDWEPLWDDLVKEYHYLGYQRLFGHRLKYLAFLGGHPVAALSWSAAAWKVGTRDLFIGWSEDQKRTYLDRVANNSRFLILPWVRIPHLASHVLSLNIRRLPKDWEQEFHQSLWLLETFVDPSRYQGTSYRASNWKSLGHTDGFAKVGRGYVHHGSIKEVYVYVLEPRFREIIGCAPKPYDLLHRPPQTLAKVEELKMMLRQGNGNPELVPAMRLTETDVHRLADELVQFHAEFHECFGRIEHHRLGLAYLSGLLSNLDAKSAEPMALEFLGENGVRPLQRFMKECRWDHPAMETKHQVSLSARIADPQGMISVDASEFIKKGKESVGVARQYCGVIGKVENCQSGVFVGYASEKGYGLLTGRLYMPEIWFSREYEQRRKDNWVPQDLIFKTKLQIASELIQQVVRSGLFPGRWIGCDATFGSDQDFLDSLPKEYYYFADVRSNSQVFLPRPRTLLPPYCGRGRRPKQRRLSSSHARPRPVSALARSAKYPWKSVVLGEGAKGPIVAQVKCLRVYPSRNGLPQDSSVWLFIRRNPDGKTKFSFSNAPLDIPFPEIGKASLLRWPIEQCFEEGKSELGMDQYEHRSWPAWHRHMLYVSLGLHFLLRLRMKFKKNSSSHFASSPEASRGCPAAPHSYAQRGATNSALSHAP
jgi:SRSO17 transposase